MNIKEYISSGIIESYVLGLASEQEGQELEKLCAQYPEIAAARNEFELSLEQHLTAGAISVPGQLKQVITTNIFSPAQDVEGAKEVSMQTKPRSVAIWKWIAAASIILLTGTAFWAVHTAQNASSSERKLASLQQELSKTQSELDALKQEAAIMQKPDVKMASMNNASNPMVYATIYWDTTSKDVYLMINNLPKPASDKQYQLWALLNNKPIDLGMITEGQDRLLYRMKHVQQAEAFAITLEPKGGSATPTSTPVVLSKL
ncbi:MAG TPA: anti-sigma factor [Flavisolibacter sp.]|nr:anti-sigma factor [Flavisolibacter sp.]